MSSYTIAGYAVALWQRTSKTVLVEGPTDKRLLDRLRLEHCIATGVTTKCSIDQIDIVTDPALANMGNKDRVLYVVGALPQLLADVQERLNYLVDREWEGVPLSPLPQAHAALATAQWGFRTKGHSIENYTLSAGTLSEFLKMYFSDGLPVDFFAQLQNRFDAMLRLGLAVSLVANAEQIIGRCEGLFRGVDVAWSGARYELNANANAKLAARGSNVDLHGLTVASLNRADVAACSEDVMRWVCHGHLASQVVRACAASLSAEVGAPAHIVSGVETGRKQDKVVHDAHVMAGWPDAQIEPLAGLVAWST